jgi:hypothetical protein
VVDERPEEPVSKKFDEAWRLVCRHYGIDPNTPMDKTCVVKMRFLEGKKVAVEDGQ